MAKLNRDILIAEALDLLDEVGLDAFTTRLLAKRLGVEQPTLYWHFRTKGQLLAAMADAAMAPHKTACALSPADDWREWFLDENRSFRQALLRRRDGARLHAGSRPGEKDMERIKYNITFLVTAGLPEQVVRMGMLTANRFTVGSVLEEQADADQNRDNDQSIGTSLIDPSAAFEAGLALIVDGMAKHISGMSERDT